MSNDFQVALDYINLSAAYWDYRLMCMARYVRSSQVNLHPYSREGLRLVRGTTPLDRTLEPSLPWQFHVYGKKARRQPKKA